MPAQLWKSVLRSIHLANDFTLKFCNCAERLTYKSKTFDIGDENGVAAHAKMHGDEKPNGMTGEK